MPFHLIVLDLQMPISDGYEALKNIKLLYDDQKIFKMDNSFMTPSLNEVNADIDQSNNPFSKQENEPIKCITPLIVACSGYVDESVIEMTQLAGFKRVFSVPLSTGLIKSDILPMLAVHI